jgi:hypothetical protein
VLSNCTDAIVVKMSRTVGKWSSEFTGRFYIHPNILLDVWDNDLEPALCAGLSVGQVRSCTLMKIERTARQ